MIRILKCELYRGFKSRGLLYSLLIGNVVVLLDFFTFVKTTAGDDRVIPVVEAWIGTDYKLAYNILFYLLLPVIATLPFAGSYYEDLKSGYMKNICIKTSRANYYTAKCIAVVMPLLFSMMLCMSCYPSLRPEKLLFLTVGILDEGFMSRTYNLNPTLYMLIYTLLDGVFAGIISMFSICVAEHTESYFSNVLSPFAMYIVIGALLESLGLGCWSLSVMLNPLQSLSNAVWRMVLVAVALIGFFVAWIMVKSKRKDIL